MQIYFVEAAGQIKVGISRDLKSRLRQLASHRKGPVEVIGTIKGDLRREQEIHNALRQYRINGEWYRDCRDVRAVIQNCFNNFEMADSQPLPSSKFGAVCKALWPSKTAEELASRVGCTVRTAAYEISGERQPSAQSILSIVAEITPKWR